jgi:hypothetical protein
MKNHAAIVLILILLACIFIYSGCSKNDPVNTGDTDTGEASVTTVTPEEADNTSVIIDDEASYKITRNDCTTFIDPQGTVAELNSFVYLQGILEITNTGKTALELSEGAFDVNKDGEPFMVSEVFLGHYPQIISPGEKGYYYYVKPTDNAVLDGNYTIVPNLSIIKTSFSNIKLDVTESSLIQDEFGKIKLAGRIKNNTQDNQTGIFIGAILFDSDDKPITILSTPLDASADDGVGFACIILAPGDEAEFEATGFYIPNTVTPDSIARYEVYAYPYQFDY